jgi:hypothetical protein
MLSPCGNSFHQAEITLSEKARQDVWIEELRKKLDEEM